MQIETNWTSFGSPFSFGLYGFESSCGSVAQMIWSEGDWRRYEWPCRSRSICPNEFTQSKLWHKCLFIEHNYCNHFLFLSVCSQLSFLIWSFCAKMLRKSRMLMILCFGVTLSSLSTSFLSHSHSLSLSRSLAFSLSNSLSLSHIGLWPSLLFLESWHLTNWVSRSKISRWRILSLRSLARTHTHTRAHSLTHSLSHTLLLIKHRAFSFYLRL